jgi:uncharacterized protein YbjT (DUF2867 family)
MTRRVLVTGATGTLGRQVVGAATAAGHQVVALSRRHHVGYTETFPGSLRSSPPDVHWHRADLFTGEGVDAAVDGAEVVVHCATQGTRGKDAVSAANLIAAARSAGVAHVIYISIVGIDRISLPYYRVKLRVEEALAASGLGRTVLRATQFHDLVKATFSIQRFSPVLWALRDVRFQPIATRDVASQLVGFIDAEPAGRVADIGGPDVHRHGDLGRMYLASQHSGRHVAEVPVPGRIVAGYKSGANLAPDNPVGAVTFADYLGQTR